MSVFDGLKYFKVSEFDSPDKRGSGEFMNREFLLKLEKAREIAGVPFFVTSGFRTQAHNRNLIARGYKADPNSYHLKGEAADIQTKDSRTRYLIVAAAIEAGINGIGIMKTAVHLDNRSVFTMFLY